MECGGLVILVMNFINAVFQMTWGTNLGPDHGQDVEGSLQEGPDQGLEKSQRPTLGTGMVQILLPNISKLILYISPWLFIFMKHAKSNVSCFYYLFTCKKDFLLCTSKFPFKNPISQGVGDFLGPTW